MFWIFKGNKNGLDDQGRTHNEALIDHIKWCMNTLSEECKTDEDYINRFNASGELTSHYYQFIKALGKEDGPKWKKIITKFLEEYFQEPIDEILKEPPTLTESNHKWQWMPIIKPKE